ncbi:hypothetical protein [Bowmanella denitrificans]|uniref:hypothetical protein n=1 Tax=Bowmanella denitrificans TaxID=366582 RepID=UPI000C9B3738|nr:hypothetical protein [Bowmanella denitrificans]
MTTSDTDKIVAFLRRVGINVHYSSIETKTFLPGLLIERGQLLIDREKLKYPGDLLHEAGHIAVTEPEHRPRLTGDVHQCGHGPAEEMSAIAWSWAASREIGIHPEVLFHPDGYKGASENYIEAFQLAQGFGYPMLIYWGLTNPPGEPDGYPKMARWLRASPSAPQKRSRR